MNPSSGPTSYRRDTKARQRGRYSYPALGGAGARVLDAMYTQRVHAKNDTVGNQNSNPRTVDQASDEREQGQVFAEIS